MSVQWLRPKRRVDSLVQKEQVCKHNKKITLQLYVTYYIGYWIFYCLFTTNFGMGAINNTVVIIVLVNEREHERWWRFNYA